MCHKIALLVLPFATLLFGCSPKKEKNVVGNPHLQSEKFQEVVNGDSTGLYNLTNNKGICVSITNYGGRLVGVIVPDKNKKPIDIEVGFNGIKDYEKSTEAYFGALVGRVANRIANGKFELDGKKYQLALNNGKNTLHGGVPGYQSKVWKVERHNDSTLLLSLHSPNGDQGFPGNLSIQVAYTLTSDNELKIEYWAQSDQNTIVNLTSHPFFNLNGEGSGTILNHSIQIFAHHYTPIDDNLIPTGKIEPVEATPFDFTTTHTIGERLDTNSNAQLKFGKGYDHNFVLDGWKNNSALLPAAKVTGDKSGITLEIFTDQQGLQFYSGNFMAGQNTFKSGKKDDFRTAFALETQHFPDAIHFPDFPSIVLEKGKQYHTLTIYKFGL